jgi:predicted acetyltransferase
MHLVKPNFEFKDSFILSARQIIAEGKASFLKAELDEENLQAYLDAVIGEETGIGLPEGYVSATNLWLIDDDEYIGSISIRHRLTESLIRMGGHIGYLIAPMHRNKGYGKKILELGLEVARKRGIKNALVTCNKANLASAKIIEANRGVLENEIFLEDRGHWERRYWITIS